VGLRGRPRDPRKDAAILDAVLALVSEIGYEAVSIEGVASRADTSKATIYRRWANKHDLVVAAVRAHQGPPHPAVDTGSLRGDLLALCRRLVDMLANSHGGLILALLQGAADDSELCDLLENAAGHTGARLPPEALERAIDRGELAPGASAYAFDEIAGAALILRTLTGHEVSDAYLQHLVDTILLPALSHETGDRPPPGPALFVGQAAR
jgi:AcrR family transcriptional regulator